MPYDTSWSGLFAPGSGPTIASQRFEGNADARCADVARLVYFDFVQRRADLEHALAVHGLTLAATFSRRWLFIDSQVLIATSPDGTAWISFRGTSNLRDFLTDAVAVPVKWPGGGLVHWGFRKAWRILEREVAVWIAANEPKRIVTTGHSLGGAIATLFAATEPRAELVTFGCPLVGNAVFAEQFAERAVRRYRNCRDIVARIPPDLVIYRQLGGLRYIDRNGSLQPDFDLAAIRADMTQGSRDFHRARRSGLPLRSLADHAPLNYVWALTGDRTPV